MGTSGVVAWSPEASWPIYLACGAAVQDSATSSAAPAISIYEANLGDPALDLKAVASLDVPAR